MNIGSSHHQLQDSEYPYALNTNIQDETGNVLDLTNEHSNILASKFKEGFKVVGYRHNLVKDRTYFFLTNPETRVSEFGEINNNSSAVDLSDAEAQCNECDFVNQLSTPLEDLTQTDTQVYTTLLEDSCNLGFNFDIRYPMKGIEIKDEKCGETIYFTDAFNPPRYIQRDNLEQYLTTGQEICGDDSNVVPTCLNAERMRIFKFFRIPEITPVEVILGGRLRRGTYEFLIAYCDRLGNELSEYFAVTNPVSIFDTTERVLTQPQLADRTNFGIRLDITNLDTEYRYYKVAVIQNADIEGAISYFIEGVHATTDTTVVYNTEENKERTDLLTIAAVKTTVNTWEGLTESNGFLFGYGITSEKEMNLQPVVNLMGAALKWQTSIAQESLYEIGTSSSLYRGYQRDEVYPFSIRFITEDGFRTALFPLVPRPAIDYTYTDESGDPQTLNEKDPVPVTADFNSIDANTPTCADNARSEFWQFYNTGVSEGFCTSDLDTVQITDDITKSCFIRSVQTLPAGTVSISLTESLNFTNLEDYINDNIDNCTAIDIPDICDALDPTTTPDTCTPIFENCTAPVLVDQSIEVAEIQNESSQFIERASLDDYIKTLPPQFCDVYEVANDGGRINDTDAEDKLNEIGGFPTPKVVFERNINFFNEECSFAAEIQNITSPTNNTIGIYHDYYIEKDLVDVQTTLDALPSTVTGTIAGGAFTDKISRGALWFRGNINGREKFILEITAESNCEEEDDIPIGSSIRFHIFDTCNSTTAVFGSVINIGTTGGLVEIDVAALGLTGTNFFVVVDVPIIGEDDLFPLPDFNYYRTAPLCGCFSVFTRDIEFERVDVTYDGIVFDKKQTYQATCTFDVPVVEDCDPQPYQFGKFSYWESTEEYPDNEELYDSSVLFVDESQIPATIKTEFEQYYTNGVDGNGNYVWRQEGGKAVTDFTCEKIRHYKFPDNKVTSFMSDSAQSPFSESVIYPIGVTIDENVINFFLDVAVTNGLLTLDQRQRIVGYEIYRGDRTLEKSVLAKGLLYDMYKYPRKGKDEYFSNFPFNSLGENTLAYETTDRNNFIQHPFNSDGNNRFTFHSPENHFTSISGVGEVKVESYQFGASRGFFSDVEDHPKWVILGNDAYSLANTLAIAEAVAEGLITLAEVAAQGSGSYWFLAGVSSGGNPFGAGIAAAATISIAFLETISAVLYKVARFRYQWLENFRNLGQPENFASYYAAEGRYNYSLTEDAIGNTLRGVSVDRRLRAGNFNTTDRDTGEGININNIDREYSHYVYLGDGFNINYPDFYKNFDNYDVDFNSSSRNFLSETEECQTGVSDEIDKNIASPYVSLKT